MRFSNVLSYDVSKGFEFKFNNLLMMNNLTSSDIEHLGKITKLFMLGLFNISTYKIPLVDWNLTSQPIDQNIQSNSISDFSTGMCIFVPMTWFVFYTFYKMPSKSYIIFCFSGLYILSKINKQA